MSFNMITPEMIARRKRCSCDICQKEAKEMEIEYSKYHSPRLEKRKLETFPVPNASKEI